MKKAWVVSLSAADGMEPVSCAAVAGAHARVHVQTRVRRRREPRHVTTSQARENSGFHAMETCCGPGTTKVRVHVRHQPCPRS